jgi:hypothetical protein
MKLRPLLREAEQRAQKAVRDYIKNALEKNASAA